jgi:hypothetical protein
MDRLNSYLRLSPSAPEASLVVKLGVTFSRSRLLTGSHRYHPGIVEQAQGRSAKTKVSPHHNYQPSNTKYVDKPKEENVLNGYSKVKVIPLHATETLVGRGSIADTHSRPRH